MAESRRGDAGTCAFCRIAGNEVPAGIVFKDDVSLAFLDRRPLFAGHCLLIPRRHYTTMLDLPADLAATLFINAQMLARAVEAAMEAEGSFVAINNRVSQSVPHVHIHIVPRRRGDGLSGFFWPRRTYASNEEMERVTEAIRAALARGAG